MEQPIIKKGTEQEEDEESLTLSGEKAKDFVSRLENLPKGDETILLDDKVNGIVLELSSKKVEIEQLGNYALQIHNHLLGTRNHIVPRYVG